MNHERILLSAAKYVTGMKHPETQSIGPVREGCVIVGCLLVFLQTASLGVIPKASVHHLRTLVVLLCKCVSGFIHRGRHHHSIGFHLICYHFKPC